MSITYDLKKKFNAQSTLKGNKVDVFHETNPSLVKNKRYENYQRTINLSALEKFNITPYCFPDRINYDNVSNIIYHPHKPEAGITPSQINLTQRQIVNDLINHTPNMYNGLDIKRCALKREPIIPQSSYLRGLLNEKDMEIVRMGTTPKAQIPQPPAGPSDDYGKDNYAMKQYDKKLIRDAYRIEKKNKEGKEISTSVINNAINKVAGYPRPKKNPTEKIIKFGGTIQKKLGFEDKPGSTIEKARIGQPVNSTVLGETKAITDLEDRLGEKTKKKIKEARFFNTKVKEYIEQTKPGEMKKVEKAKATLAKIKEGKIKLKPEIREKLKLLVKKKQQKETIASSSSLVPKPKFDDDDDDDGSIDSGETTFDETKTIAEHKTKLSGWGIPLDISDTISYSGTNKEKYDVLNTIAKTLFQRKEVEKFVNMVSTANGKNLRKMKKIKILREIIKNLT